MSILIKDGIVVTQDVKRRVLRTDVLIKGNKISDIGKHKMREADQVIDAKGKIVIPGLINLHTHVAMSTMRGYADDLPLEKFLEKTFAADAKRKSDDVLEGARLGCAELALTGTTSFLDLYYGQDKIGKATEE
ncbi:MAG: amidohydrolase family protein, partial [Thermoplasmata archaeon]|nr:amidohydrolase family protein [Thermoplasmata archaeon]